MVKYFLVMILLLSMGCSIIKTEPKTSIPLDTRAILATLKTRYDLVNTMRTLVNFKMESQGKKEEVRGILNYEKPEKMSVYGMGPFNEPKVIALVVEQTLQIYFVAENELIKGELTNDVLKRIFDIDLRISDIRSAIFANPFLDGNTNNLELQDYQDEYVIKRKSKDENYQEEILILTKGIVVDKWKILDSKGKMIQEITFSKYKEVGGILRPLKAIIYRPLDNTKISIESIDPEINIKLSKTTFELPIPEDAKVYQLSEIKRNEEINSQ